MRRLAIVLVLSVVMPLAAAADPVLVTITGEVEYNQVTIGDFANSIVRPGDPATLLFMLDSEDFVNSVSFPTRGYVINQPSFQIQLGSATGALKNPFPGTPYFVVRDNDPAVDGFFLSKGTDFPSGIDLNVAANVAGTRFFQSAFEVSYTGTTLSSLDILDAAGTYDFTGLGNFYYVILDLGFEPIGMIFSQMTIELPVPAEETTWGGIKSLYR